MLEIGYDSSQQIHTTLKGKVLGSTRCLQGFLKVTWGDVEVWNIYGRNE